MAEKRTGVIGVIGLWHLGSVSVAAWMSAGVRVVAWDPDEKLRASIAACRGTVTEPGLAEALRSGSDQGLLTIADHANDAIVAATVVQLAFDTEVGKSGAHDDPRLDEAVAAFATLAEDGSLLLVSSQVPVGTCRRWRELLEREDRGLQIAHAPENLRLGSALEDFVQPDRLLIGADDPATLERTADILAPFSGTPLTMSLTAAELVKHATNAYLALCIAFANDLAWLSLAAGADPGEVAAGLRADPRVSPAAPLRPGAAFSGATLLRDVVALRTLGESCGRPDLFAAIIVANERHSGIAFAWLEELLGTLEGAKVAVAGLTYKPGTSTLRDSLPLRLVSQLLQRGAVVSVWDPAAEPIGAAPGLTRVESLEACVQDTDALAVMTALPELAEVDWKSLAPARRLLVDACLGVNQATVERAGWTYRGLALT